VGCNFSCSACRTEVTEEQKKRSWQVPIYLSPLSKKPGQDFERICGPAIIYRLDCAPEAPTYFIIQEPWDISNHSRIMHNLCNRNHQHAHLLCFFHQACHYILRWICVTTACTTRIRHQLAQLDSEQFVQIWSTIIWKYLKGRRRRSLEYEQAEELVKQAMEVTELKKKEFSGGPSIHFGQK